MTRGEYNSVLESKQVGQEHENFKRRIRMDIQWKCCDVNYTEQKKHVWD
jgi:hypothetical protein